MFQIHRRRVQEFLPATNQESGTQRDELIQLFELALVILERTTNVFETRNFLFGAMAQRQRV